MLELGSKVRVQEEGRFIHGTEQVGYMEWKELGRGVCFVPASEEDYCEFGLHTFRMGEGEMHYPIIFKLDPKRMTIQFVNNEVYVNRGIVHWDEPVKLSKLVVNNMFLLEQAYTL